MNENGRIGCLLKKMEGKKILEAFLETQKGTFKVETTSDMEKFHVIDTEKYNEDMNAAVDDNTRTFDHSDIASIGAFIAALESGTELSIKVTDEKITMFDESKAAAAITDNTSLWAVINGVCINTDWIQTDDLQYVRQAAENADVGYQYLAEMIFEETAYEELDYRIIEGDEDAAYHELKHRLYILEPLSMKGETDE